MQKTTGISDKAIKDMISIQGSYAVFIMASNDRVTEFPQKYNLQWSYPVNNTVKLNWQYFISRYEVFSLIFIIQWSIFASK